MDHESIHFFVGVDAGTTDHLEVALNRAGKKIRDKFLPQDEAKLNTLIMFLSQHGTWLFMVDVPVGQVVALEVVSRATRVKDGISDAGCVLSGAPVLAGS